MTHRTLIRIPLYILFLAVILFVSAGRLDWLMAWVFLGVYVAIILVTIFLVDPELIEERTHIRAGIKRWDFALAGLAIVFLMPATLIVAGLDAGRFRWSPSFPVWVQLLALLAYVLGSAIVSWAMAANKFFSTFVRIQKERGHYVVTGGPYRYVRHPGYTGAIVVSISLPLLLGSLWALIPAMVGVCILVIRTFFEDNTLKKELEGYNEYAGRVRYRLLPGIW